MSISLNINAQDAPNRAALIAWHAQAKPRWSLVMDDSGLGLCNDLHAASPATNIIHRDYGVFGGDDGLHEKVAPELWVQHQHETLKGRFWAYAGNEPGFTDALAKWTVAVIKEAIRLQQPVVIFNLGVGKPENIDDWKRMHEPLKLAYENPQYVAVGVHEYFVGQPTSGFVGGAPNGYTQDGKQVHPDFTSDWPENPLSLGMLWHCGRVLKMLEYCKAQGWNKPRVVLTEHGADGVNDIKWWTDTLPRAPGFENIRGWKSHRACWRSLSPKASIEDYYADALCYLDKYVYQALGVEAQLVFSWTRNPQWQSDFDVSDAPTLLVHLARHNAKQDAAAPPEPPPPVKPVVTVPPNMGLPVNGRNTLIYATAIYHAPDGQQVGSVPPNGTYTYYPGAVVKLPDNRVWVFVEYGKIQGWMRAGDTDIWEIPGLPPPTDEATRAKLEQLAARIEELSNEFDNMIAAINAVFEKHMKPRGE